MNVNAKWIGTLCAVAIAGGALGLRWLGLAPTIAPEDVVLQGEVIEAALLRDDPTFSFPNDWAAVVRLENRSGKPLHSSEGHSYFHLVYPVVGGFQTLAWDYGAGLDGDGAEGGAGADEEAYSMGNHSYTFERLQRHMDEEIGFGEEIGWSVVGFTYTGAEPTARVRYELIASDGSAGARPDPRRAYVAYVHYEKRWGKDLSWTKAVPIDVVSGSKAGGIDDEI